MYKTKRRLLSTTFNVVILIVLVAITYFSMPFIKESSPKFVAFAWIFAALVYFSLVILSYVAMNFFETKLREDSFEKNETEILSTFISDLRFCYSLDDFYELLSKDLEIRGDCGIIFVNRLNNYVLYNSPNKVTSSNEITQLFEMNYPVDWKDGFYLIGENFGVVSKIKQARGFFLVNQNHHLYVLCRYTRLFDSEIFPMLYEEYSRFLSRAQTISDLSEISSLSKQWDQLAETQKSFLPQVMPNIQKLSISAYFRPLVNVSGDYYTVLPISETKTLLMLGDVSGKGLAAALVMGLVMNTVKIFEDKDNLPSMIRALDKAIKGMKLQDKYTVVFIGIVDTQKMTIRYINASMSDPLVITKSPNGYRIKPLTSNCSLVGIIDLDDIEVAEQKLFRGDVILMASDGVSEVMDENGVELGTTKLYQDSIKSSAAKSPKEFINDVVNLVFTYNKGKKLRDDLTMLVAKVEG